MFILANQKQCCTYPNWLVSAKSWVALDRDSSRLLASPYNITILDRNETLLSCYSIISDNHRRHHSRAFQDLQVKIIAKATRDWYA